MKDIQRVSRRAASFAVATLMAGVTTSAVFETQREASVGAQSADLWSQALAFLPNEHWIHAGDSIWSTFATDEFHAVTFLKPGKVWQPPLSAKWRPR
jgi:plastocyanin